MTATNGLAPELALDMGTGTTRLALPDAQLLIEQPSVLESADEPEAPRRAQRLVEHPIKRGVVMDVEAAARMLAPQILAARGPAPMKPRVLACHPSDASLGERDRLVAAILLAGAGAVQLTSEPVAAVVGSTEPQADAARARMIVDLGEGVTDIAVVVEGHLLASAALRLGLADIRHHIEREVRAEQGVALRPRELAALITQQASASGWLPVERAPGRSRHGRPQGRRALQRLVLVNSAVVARATEGVLEAIGRNASNVLRALAWKEIAAIAHDGILLTGGGALVPALSRGIAEQLGVGVRVATDPLHAVIRGACELLQHCRPDEWLTTALALEPAPTAI